MKKKMGRPRLSKKGLSEIVLSVRMPPDDAAKVLQAVRASGQTKPDWLRAALLAAARRT